MKATCIAFTDGLRKVLDRLATDGGTHLGPLIESFLREIPAVKRKKIELGIEWTDRPPRGNLSRQKKATPAKKSFLSKWEKVIKEDHIRRDAT